MDTSDLSHHILSRFNADLEGLRSAVLQMGGLVEQQLQDGVKALCSGDIRLGEQVARLDHRVNEMEVAIDEDCSRILATRNPTASDLRMIVAIIKTITDLERIGDESEKLGHVAMRLASVEHPVDRYREIRHLGGLVGDMLRGALDAFARLDTDSALAVARRDRIVDEEHDAIQRQCITFMMEDPRSIRRTLDVLWMARALERVGDHAKNICEYVVYLVLGKDIRHRSVEDVERALAEASASRSGPPVRTAGPAAG